MTKYYNVKHDGTNLKYTDETGIQTVSAGDVGGLYGINVETLTGDKTLTSGTDEIYQFLNPDGANRVITLDTASASAGDRWIIRNQSANTITYYLNIQQAAATIDKCYSGGVKEYIFDGTNWKFVELGSGEASTEDNNIALGTYSLAYGSGVAIGRDADGSTRGVGVGYYADGASNGVGVGYYADGASNGVALGYFSNTNLKHDAVAIGHYSKTERYAEIAHNINGNDTDQENNITIGGWEGSTANATPTEIYCGGTANQRFTVRASSVLVFTIHIGARDNTSGDCAAYEFKGAIKRDGAGNTAIMGTVNKTIVAEDDATWDVAVTADDTNEALIITVTGDASNTVQWVARLDGVETHF